MVDDQQLLQKLTFLPLMMKGPPKAAPKEVVIKTPQVKVPKRRVEKVRVMDNTLQIFRHDFIPQQFNGETSNMFKAFLLTKNNRPIVYTMTAENGNLYLYRNEKAVTDRAGDIVQSLHDFQICTIDTPEEKFLDKSGKYFCLLVTKEGAHRKIYFPVYDSLYLATNVALQAQGHSTRAAQYA